MSGEGYNVFMVEYRLGVQDPFMPGTRYHTVVFVQTKDNGSGKIHHVIGDVVSPEGMTYDCKKGKAPETSATYHSKTYLGQVRVTDYPAAVEQLLQSLPTPPRQRIFSPNTVEYEQCKPDGTIYQRDEPRPPYWKCTEWTREYAIPALQERFLFPDAVPSEWV